MTSDPVLDWLVDAERQGAREAFFEVRRDSVQIRWRIHVHASRYENQRRYVPSGIPDGQRTHGTRDVLHVRG